MGMRESWPQIKEIISYLVFCTPLHLFLLKWTIAIQYLVNSPKKSAAEYVQNSAAIRLTDTKNIFTIFTEIIMHIVPPPPQKKKNTHPLFSISHWYYSRPKRNGRQWLCKIFEGKQGALWSRRKWSILSNYWTRLKAEVDDNTLRDLHTSSHDTKAEFNNRFAIHWKYF